MIKGFSLYYVFNAMKSKAKFAVLIFKKVTFILPYLRKYFWPCEDMGIAPNLSFFSDRALRSPQVLFIYSFLYSNFFSPHLFLSLTHTLSLSSCLSICLSTYISLSYVLIPHFFQLRSFKFSPTYFIWTKYLDSLFWIMT
jgi:hypothetical protein